MSIRDDWWLMEVKEGDKLIVRRSPFVGNCIDEEVTVSRVTNNYIVANGVRYRKYGHGWGAGANPDRRIMKRAN